MTDALVALVARAHARRDSVTLGAACRGLRGSARRELIEELGELIRVHPTANFSLLLDGARLLYEVSVFESAQELLIAAGKLAPKDPAVFRLLGEVLMRRGDAERAEKVLERAIQCGAADPLARTWLAQARALKLQQPRTGTVGVAQEVLRQFGPPFVDAEASSWARAAAANETQAALDQPSSDAHLVPDGALFGPGGATARAAPKQLPTTAGIGQLAAPFAVGAVAAARAKPEAPPSGNEAAEAENPFAESESSAVSMFMGAPQARRAEPPRQRATPPASAQIDAEHMRMVANKPAYVQHTSTSVPRQGETGVGSLPDVRNVLTVLQSTGVFEATVDNQIRAEWTPPAAREKRRGIKRLITAMMLTALAAAGGSVVVKRERQRAHLAAEAKLDVVERDLALADATKLDAAEQALSASFDLDSRSSRAAHLWLRERVLRGLLVSGADVTGVEEAVGRCQKVGLDGRSFAAGTVAACMFSGDLASAAAAIARLDGVAGKDALYQLVAGTVLERAGDPHAADRYALAVQLDPALFLAELAAVRLQAIQGDLPRAKVAADALRAKYPARAEALAIAAFVAARIASQDTSDSIARATAEATSATALARASELPLTLRAISPFLRAMSADRGHQTADLKKALGESIATADSPELATYLGEVAADRGDESLARRAALTALGQSPLYLPARALAARIALLGGRINEAETATAGLEPQSTAVAVVRAATAYERLDVKGHALALTMGGVGGNATALPWALLPLARAQITLAGRTRLTDNELRELQTTHAPWADLVVMDTLLDVGELNRARLIANEWDLAPRLPLRQLRQARLLRYEAKLVEAELASADAFHPDSISVRTLWERVQCLIAAGKREQARTLLGNYPALVGDLSPWFTAYAISLANQPNPAARAIELRAAARNLKPLADDAPYGIRLILFTIAGALKDKVRGAELYKSLGAQKSSNPDVIATATALQLTKAR